MSAGGDSMSWAAVAGLYVFVGLLLAGAGWLVIVIADRAEDGRLGRNAWAGVRTRTTRSSDEAWLAAHRASASLTTSGGVALVVAAVLAPVVALALGAGDTDEAMGWWAGVILTGTAVSTVLIVAGAVRGHRAAQEIAGH